VFGSFNLQECATTAVPHGPNVGGATEHKRVRG
jgi:hypothetical protein